MNTELIQSPETRSFSRLGSCPPGFLEQSIKHKDWYGDEIDSSWKWCTPLDEINEKKEVVKEEKVSPHNFRARRVR